MVYSVRVCVWWCSVRSAVWGCVQCEGVHLMVYSVRVYSVMVCTWWCSVRMCSARMCTLWSTRSAASYWRTSGSCMITATPPALPSWSPQWSMPGPHRQLRRLCPNEWRGNVGNLHCGGIIVTWIGDEWWGIRGWDVAEGKDEGRGNVRKEERCGDER